jgi:transcriptional regulator with XRE-family HTH domain
MKDPQEYQGALGQAITARREKLGYTREKLARIIGVDTDYVAFVEDGKNDLELSEMIVIARALRIPLSTLLALAECVLPEG